jgi:hypothetical protein
MLVALPVCLKIAVISQINIFERIIKKSAGVVSLNHLSLLELDIYVRHLASNLNFFFEDYVSKGKAMLFESIFINHSLACPATTAGSFCFCLDFKRVK